MDNKFKRVADDDPRRCQQVVARGKYQCSYERIEGSDFCPMHAGNQNNRLFREEERRKDFNYQLQKYRARVTAFAENPQVKSLREEVGVLRLLLEETLNKCQNTNELLIYSTKISGLVIQIEKLVTSCNTLETKTGQLLDKSVVIKLVEQIISIICAYISDVDLLEQLSNDIETMMATQYTDPTSVGGK